MGNRRKFKMKKNKNTSFEASLTYKRIMDSKLPCYFISPHLDDAIFSSASLLDTLVKNGNKVVIINVFTEASPWPYTLSVYKFLWQCGYLSAEKLFVDRRREDSHVINKLGASVNNLGFTDALWRRHPVIGVKKLLSKVIGEFSYVYPMYRYGLAQGLVSHYDSFLYGQITDNLKKVIKHKNSMIFAPLAIGRHVDHLIVRDVCKSTFDNSRVIYWSDYPYEVDKPMENEFIKKNKLSPLRLNIKSPLKNGLINSYTSQLKVIFGGVRDHSNILETYYGYGGYNVK